MPEDSRRERHFDREAEKRSRRNFVLMIAAFAGLAMVGGVALALWIISPPDEDAPPPITVAEEKPVDPSGFEPFEDDEPEPEPKKVKTGVKRKLDSRDIDKGIGRIRAALNACAVTHGAIDGTLVTVDFSVASNGGVTEAYSRSPHSKTPLGLCVAKVIRTKGKFRRTKEGLGDVRRTIKLRRTSG